MNLTGGYARLEQGFSVIRYSAVSWSRRSISGYPGGSISSSGSAHEKRCLLHVACAVLLLPTPIWASQAQRSKPIAPTPPEMLLEGGRKLTCERSFNSQREVKPKRGFWNKRGRLRRRRAGFPHPGPSLQHRRRFARTHHCDRPGRLRACTSSTSSSRSTSSCRAWKRAKIPC